MAILSTQLQGSKLSLKGNTPKKRDGALDTSTVHSVNSLAVSKLDLDGTTPPKYLDSLPK
jgi:hypothetical protein